MVQPLKKTWCKHHTASVGMYNMAINMLYKLQSCVLWGFFMWQGVCNGSGSCHRGACASFLCIVQFRPKLWLHWTRSHNSTFSDAVVAKGVLFSSYMQKVKRTDKKSQQQQKEKKIQEYSHYPHLKSAICWLYLFMLFLLAPSHHPGNKPVRLFTDGRTQNNPHLHPHTLCLCTLFFFSFPSDTFSTPTLITAPVMQASKLPHMGCTHTLAICLHL